MEPVSAAFAIGSSLIQGIGSLQAGNRNRAAAEAQAREEERAMVADIARLREESRAAIGQQSANQFANGFEGGSGTALDALRESQINAALDVMERRRQGTAAASAAREEGRLRQSEGRWGLASGLLAGASAVVGQQSDWAQAKQGRSTGGIA